MLKLEISLEALDEGGLTALLGQVARLQAQILRRLDPARGAPPPAAEPPGVWNLTASQVRERTGMSRSWLYRNAHKLPFAGKVGTRWRFSAARLERYVQQQKQQQKAA